MRKAEIILKEKFILQGNAIERKERELTLQADSDTH
jgi:hypothetical protein